MFVALWQAPEQAPAKRRRVTGKPTTASIVIAVPRASTAHAFGLCPPQTAAFEASAAGGLLSLPTDTPHTLLADPGETARTLEPPPPPPPPPLPPAPEKTLTTDETLSDDEGSGEGKAIASSRATAAPAMAPAAVSQAGVAPAAELPTVSLEASSLSNSTDFAEAARRGSMQALTYLQTRRSLQPYEDAIYSSLRSSEPEYVFFHLARRGAF